MPYFSNISFILFAFVFVVVNFAYSFKFFQSVAIGFSTVDGFALLEMLF